MNLNDIIEDLDLDDLVAEFRGEYEDERFKELLQDAAKAYISLVVAYTKALMDEDAVGAKKFKEAFAGHATAMKLLDAAAKQKFYNSLIDFAKKKLPNCAGNMIHLVRSAL